MNPESAGRMGVQVAIQVRVAGEGVVESFASATGPTQRVYEEPQRGEIVEPILRADAPIFIRSPLAGSGPPRTRSQYLL